MENYKEKIIKHIENNTDWITLTELRKTSGFSETLSTVKARGIELLKIVLNDDNCGWAESGGLRVYKNVETDEESGGIGIKFVWEDFNSRIFQYGNSFESINGEDKETVIATI